MRVFATLTTLAFIVAILTVVGLTMVLSASAVKAIHADLEADEWPAELVSVFGLITSSMNFT